MINGITPTSIDYVPERDIEVHHIQVEYARITQMLGDDGIVDSSISH